MQHSLTSILSSVVYGSNEEEQARVRTGKNGLLYPDTFADGRLAFMTPSTSALAVLYARNHNYIAERILQINERGDYYDEKALQQIQRDDVKLPADQRKYDKIVRAQDEDVFQRSRLVNCGCFVHVILTDYIPAILNQPGNTSWYLNPLDDMRDPSGKRVERATGNHVSAEFSVLYRWHAAISRRDEAWLNGMFSELWPGRDPATLAPKEFYATMEKMKESLGDPQRPDQWTPHGWERDEHGNFDDAVIAKTLMDATDDVAGAFQAHGSPAAMRVVDSLGIQQNRDWALCSLNEFRVFLGLRPYQDFMVSAPKLATDSD